MKGHTIKGRVHPPHPATLSAESDLVKLVKELEALRKDKARYEEQIEEASDASRAAFIDYNMAANRNNGVIEMTNRTLRVTRVQIENVEELLQKLTSSRDHPRNVCAQAIR